MPEYEVKVTFHIFPYRKFNISAGNEEEASKLVKHEAQQMISSLRYTVTSIKPKRYSMDDFLK